MSVLGYAAGQQDRQRHYSACIKGDEYHMRTGFRYDAYSCSKQYHQCGVPAYPVLYVHIAHRDTEQGKYSRCPSENDRKMPFYNMLPQMLFHEMVRGKAQHTKDNQAQYGEYHIHPVFTEQVKRECGFCMHVSFMQMLVPEPSCNKGCYEHCDTDEHHCPAPSQVTFTFIYYRGGVMSVPVCAALSLVIRMQLEYVVIRQAVCRIRVNMSSGQHLVSDEIH